MKIVSRFRLHPIAVLVSTLALFCLIAAVPATLDLGDFSIKPKDAKATPSDSDDGGDDGDDGGDDSDSDADSGSSSAGPSADSESSADADSGDDGDSETRDSAEIGASGSTNFAVRIPLPTIGDPRSIPTMFVVYFDWDSDQLDESAQSVLSEAEAAIGKLGGARVSVIGNTDRSGPRAYNEGLANAVPRP